MKPMLFGLVLLFATTAFAQQLGQRSPTSPPQTTPPSLCSTLIEALWNHLEDNTQIGSLRAICSTCRWEMTTSFVATNTNGVSSSPPST